MPKPLAMNNITGLAHDELAFRVEDVQHAVHLLLVLWILVLIISLALYKSALMLHARPTFVGSMLGVAEYEG